MDIAYIVSQMVNSLHIPICIYKADENTIVRTGQNKGDMVLTQKEEAFFKDNFLFLKEKNEPVLSKLSENVLYMTIKMEDTKYILYGPVIIKPITQNELTKVKKDFKKLVDFGIEIQPCQMEDFVSGGLMLYHILSGVKLDNADFWKSNQDNFPSVSQMYSKLSENIFERQEKQSIHNPYSQELREIESIENGDVVALNQSIAETYEGEIGILAKDPLRHHKNVAIGNITMASRAAVRGGVNVELAFSMADSFIQQIEEIDNVSEVEVYKREAQRAYATAVEKQNHKGNKSKNPLVEDVKNYIFSHLHDNIRIEEIARTLHVSSDYLSHVFSSSENVTIKRYILQEKIDRSKNLLSYSNYSLQEIAFYLGFSTQSYFTKIFREIVGMTPGEYRINYKMKENF